MPPVHKHGNKEQKGDDPRQPFTKVSANEITEKEEKGRNAHSATQLITPIWHVLL